MPEENTLFLDSRALPEFPKSTQHPKKESETLHQGWEGASRDNCGTQDKNLSYGLSFESSEHSNRR